MDILVGVFQIEPDHPHKLIYEWRYKVRYGEKYEPDIGCT